MYYSDVVANVFTSFGSVCFLGIHSAAYLLGSDFHGIHWLGCPVEENNRSCRRYCFPFPCLWIGTSLYSSIVMNDSLGGLTSLSVLDYTQLQRTRPRAQIWHHHSNHLCLNVVDDVLGILCGWWNTEVIPPVLQIAYFGGYHSSRWLMGIVRSCCTHHTRPIISFSQS